MERQRIIDYIRSLSTRRDSDTLASIRKEAVSDRVPIIRRETQELLHILIEMRKPKRILEVGAAIGFSSVFMSECAGADTVITTIENYPPRIERAKANIEMAGLSDRIQLIPGDAGEILPGLEGSYDMIFMDAAKGQYISFFPQVMRLLEKGGLLVSDNVLQDGDIFESRYGIRRRNHTIHHRMREYLYTLTHDPRLHTIILETGDGVAVSLAVETPGERQKAETEEENK